MQKPLTHSREGEAPAEPRTLGARGSAGASPSPEARFLTFDLGTTLYKVALFDSRGGMLDIERVSPPIEHRRENWWELNALAMFVTIALAVQKLRERAGDDWQRISAISFATQANSFTLLDAGNSPLMPLILWPDQRAGELSDELEGLAHLPGFRETTGMPRFGPLLGLAKLLWLRRHPNGVAHPRRFCYLSDYLTLVMTGSLCTEAGVAGLSGAADVHRLGWWLPALQQLNIPLDWMPPIVRAGTDLGPILPGIADQLNLPHTCRFVVGCLDQYAGAIGTGTIEPGQICETTGTVLAAVRLSDHYDPNPAPTVFQGPAFTDDRFFQMCFSSTSANLLEWYRNQLPDKPSFDALTQAAITAPSADLVIEPYNNTGSIESSFRHVQPHHTTGLVTRAIMQRVAQSLADQVHSLSHDASLKEIRSAGGAARNDFWLQMKADTLGTRVCAIDAEEPTSLGAAMLAASAMGFGDLQSLARQWVKVRATFHPRQVSS